VVIATRHPSPGSPTTLAAGTRASVKKTSAKPAWPSSWVIGRASTPSVDISTPMNEIPA
jgi:hypothetical protein